MERIGESERRYFIDWLRVFAVAVLVPFHTGMIFCHWGFHLKNDVTSTAITIQNAFINSWHMPLFFFLSGAGTYYALGFRSAGVYVKERLLRLFVPLVFGVLALCPPQIYFERLQKHQFSGSFLEFYPHFFNGPYPEGNLSWQHLWFLLYLFIMSLAALPLFRYLRGERGRAALEKFIAFFTRRFSIYLPVLPFILIQFAAREGYPNGDQSLVGDMDNFTQHTIVFIYGYVFCSSGGFWERVEKNGAASLVAGLSCFIAKLLMEIFLPGDYLDAHIAAGAVFLVLGSLGTWCLLLGILGYGKKYLDFTNAALKYAVEAALPFYILHQTVIIWIGYYVVRADWNLYLKYFFLIAASYAGALAIYDALVKRWNPVRFLFGMRPAKRS